MNPASNFSDKHFLKQYWQKKPCLIRNAYPNLDGVISGDELAGLACEAGVEARLVFSNPEHAEWHCKFAPFGDSDFTALDNKNWTLLVQAVDQFIPEIKALLDDFSFLPKWRLDDVMLSYATPGGGVGPHFDYYDVFLIQTSGSREWKMGQACNSSTALREHEDLKLLEKFIGSETHVLEQGDMLYIPAGTAHWGTALSDGCITASVGFRAPSHRELLSGAIEQLASEFNEDQRYMDSELKPDTDPYLINESVKHQLSTIWDNLDKNCFMQSVTEQLGLQVTEVRHDDLFEIANYSVDEIKGATITHHPMSRLAYRKNKDAVTLYVNGLGHSTNLETALAVCHSEYSNIERLELSLIQELLNQGFLLIDT